MRSPRVSRVLACLAALTLLAVGCTNTPPPPAPSAEPTTTPAGVVPSQIVASVDDVVGGYNPHRVADASTVTSALAQLTLPSVFRVDADGKPKLDETLMKSAKVVDSDPFTVAYEIRPDAQWSDGAPIAAEDFTYLAEAMRSETGTVAPAGYELISDVASRAGGKRVEVRFSDPYPGWRSLFSHLLPAHLLKDAPGGWNAALANNFPAYGGPFSIKVLDQARGEIILERNERYWAKPAAVDQLVLRRSDRTDMVSSLRSGSDQFTLTRAGVEDLGAFTGLGPRFVQHTVPRPELAQVMLRSARLADDTLRAAVVALIDRPKLIGAGTEGGPSSTLAADAQVRAPGQPRYAPTIPADRRKADPAKAARLLRASGYALSQGVWRSGVSGQELSLVIGSPIDREPYPRIAAELERQLTAAGIAIERVTPPARELAALPETPSVDSEESGKGEVPIDIVVGPRVVGPDFGANLATVLGCDWPKADNGATASPDPANSVNQAGFCSGEREDVLLSAMTGELSSGEASRRLEPALWRENTLIPLFQLADTLVLGDGVSGVTPGPPMIGPFGSAVNWIRTGR